MEIVSWFNGTSIRNDSRGSAEPSFLRILFAIATAGLMYAMAVLSIGLAFETALGQFDCFDACDESFLDRYFVILPGIALLLFLSSGFVAYLIGRTRWLLLLPLVVAVVGTVAVIAAQYT